MLLYEKLSKINLFIDETYNYKSNFNFFKNIIEIDSADYRNALNIIENNLVIYDYSSLVCSLSQLNKLKYDIKPTVYAIVGNIGSGKSTFIHLLKELNIFDDDLNILMEDIYKSIFFNEISDLKKSYAFAKTFLKEKLLHYVKQSANILLEMVPSNDLKLEILKKLKEIGYKIVIFFIDTKDINHNIERVKKRITLGADFVSDEKIINREYKTNNNFKKLLNIKDEFYYFISFKNCFELISYWIKDDRIDIKNCYELEELLKM